MHSKSIPRPPGAVAAEPPEPPTYCDRRDCGHLMTPGLRYEATRTVDVRICWTCGNETPPLYGQSARLVTRTRGCGWCGERFALTPTDPDRKTCSLACADKRATVAQQFASRGRRLRARRAS